jgi:hypothetical protein
MWLFSLPLCQGIRSSLMNRYASDFICYSDLQIYFINYPQACSQLGVFSPVTPGAGSGIKDRVAIFISLTLNHAEKCPLKITIIVALDNASPDIVEI